MALSAFAEELYNVGEIQSVLEPLPLGTAENPPSVFLQLSASEPVTVKNRMP